ncbi:uncharacterized protein LOC115881707 [Sitophilus oryzae]|uniref:Uncharacterized protein LOC115881707 n=1 Tax=Sitophilus oryzae TaxID=7048 RepID=A0A6J2XWN1_SITOR|nr:uncharacterized protein LOC115881707 [Sitophilus oryzae]
MKITVAVFLLTIAGSGWANKDLNYELQINKKILENLLQKLEPLQDELSVGTEGHITAVINDYADQLLENIYTYSVNKGFDTIALDDYDNWFLTASVTLTNGTLGGLTNIQRSDDVVVTYTSSSKLLDVTIPITFKKIYFQYHYHVIVLLIGPEGTMTGKIRDLSMELKLSFDFNEYQATYTKASIKSSGHIDVTFDGGLVEIVVNILSELATTILHPLIVLVIEGEINNVLGKVVENINESISNILNPQ